MVGLEISIVQHRCFNGSKMSPCISVEEIIFLYFINDTYEINVRTVFIFNLVEKVYTRVIGEETILTVVKLQMHCPRGKQENCEHDGPKGLLWMFDTNFG